MKLLMKKVGVTTENVPAESTKEIEEQVPKKIRNRPLFHVKVSNIIYIYSLFIHKCLTTLHFYLTFVFVVDS